jgi:hypothetical protein
VLRAFEAAAPVILSKERDMYRIPGLCLGKVLLKKSQAKGTINDINWFPVIRGLPPRGLGEEKLCEHLKSLLETQDKEEGHSFLSAPPLS